MLNDYRQKIRHGRNYFAANLATRALAFISIPVYTRLLSTEEYGILGSVMALSADRSISRYYFDKLHDDDLRIFVGTSIISAVAIFTISSILLVKYSTYYATLVGLEKGVIYLIIPTSFVNIIGFIFEQIYCPQKKSKLIATSSIFRIYLGIVLLTSLIPKKTAPLIKLVNGLNWMEGDSEVRLARRKRISRSLHKCLNLWYPNAPVFGKLKTINGGLELPKPHKRWREGRRGDRVNTILVGCGLNFRKAYISDASEIRNIILFSPDYVRTKIEQMGQVIRIVDPVNVIAKLRVA